MITKGQGKRRSPKKSSRDDRFTREMIGTAEGMRSVGIMDEAAYKKITTRLKASDGRGAGAGR